MKKIKLINKLSQTSRLEKPEVLQLHHYHEKKFLLLTLLLQVKLLGSVCQTSGTCAKRAKQATKIDNAAACLSFLKYLAFLRPAADRAVSILPWVVSRGCSYGLLWAGLIFQKNVRKDNPTPAYSPESDRGVSRHLL
jgi:hypothetical protein